jgi:uncharacterized protein YndB with AHSA1/START domain
MTDTDTAGRDTYEVRDEAVLPATTEDVWTVLSDLATWRDWWTLIRVEPLDPAAPTAVAPGLRFRIEGSRPGATSTRGWNVEVREVVPNERIELEYTDGDLVGFTAWEVAPAPDGGTRVAYVYHAVRATNDDAAATFARYGTRLHSAAMAVDALAGLRRAVAGQPLDDTWRAEVQSAVAERVGALDRSLTND